MYIYSFLTAADCCAVLFLGLNCFPFPPPRTASHALSVHQPTREKLYKIMFWEKSEMYEKKRDRDAPFAVIAFLHFSNISTAVVVDVSSYSYSL